ncbi:MAG: C25 family cysteine peptidase, partial [Candidatus Marinimicrobia bacterium]|nr:C25 family cysteine peptidase [Candidatus Neomarinimicrobiota bacterium]
MNKLTYNIITLFLPVSLIFAGVSVNQSRPVDFSFQKTNSSEMVLEILLDDISLKTVEYHNEFYTELTVKGAGYHYTVGAPKLPLIRKLIKIPENSRIEYEIAIHSEENLDLSQTNFPDPILPVQPFRRKSATGRTQVVISNEIYGKDDYYAPGIVNTHESFKMGGINGVMLDFFPVSYNPVRHSLKLITSATVTVKIIQDRFKKSTAKSPIYHPDFDRIARDIFVNYDETDSQIKSTAPLNFLVIAGDQFADNTESHTYLRWKRQCGFNTILKSVSELGGTAASIKDYILSHYSSDSPPAYVLLVGDVAEIPAWTGMIGETETDAPYARMDSSDFIPDLMIGRFSAADDSDLSAIIHKSMAYAQCDVSSLDAFNKVTFIATNDPDYWELTEASHNYVIDTYLKNRGVYTDHIKGHSDGSTLDIAQALNDGRTICHYSGHGLEFEWQGPEFLQSNIGEFNYGSVPAFIISNACLTGSFADAEPECFGESWIRTADKGAFAFIGASNSSYWEPDDIMERGMYDGFFEDGETSIGAM